MGSAIPNPDLAAEQATTIETGYDTPVGRRSNVSLTAFYTAVNDLVQAFYLEPNLFQLQNVGDVRNAGLEAEWRLRPVRAFQGSIGYSYLHRRSVGEPVVPLLNTPAHKAFGSVTFTGLPHVRLMASVNRESSRDAQDDGGLLLDLDGYTTVDAKATVDVARGVEVSIFGSNLLDENYELYAGFPEEGRAVRVEARWRF
jgi:iron complex outermembrane receptor protein